MYAHIYPITDDAALCWCLLDISCDAFMLYLNHSSKMKCLKACYTCFSKQFPGLCMNLYSLGSHVVPKEYHCQKTPPEPPLPPKRCVRAGRDCQTTLRMVRSVIEIVSEHRIKYHYWDFFRSLRWSHLSLKYWGQWVMDRIERTETLFLRLSQSLKVRSISWCKMVSWCSNTSYQLV